MTGYLWAAVTVMAVRKHRTAIIGLTTVAVVDIVIRFDT